MEDGLITGTEIVDPGSGYSSDMPPAVMLSGGSRLDATLNPGDVRPSWYVIGILIMAVATGSYTIFGGLRAVIITDVILSVLLLGAGLIVAFVTFSQPEVQGWANMVAMNGEAVSAVTPVQPFKPSCITVDRSTHRVDGLALLLLGRKSVHRAASIVCTE